HDRQLQIRTAFRHAFVRSWFEGSDGAAVTALSDAVELAEEVGDRALSIEGHMWLGSVLLNLGELIRAEEELARAAALAGELASRRDQARAEFLLGGARYYLGQIGEAERLS